MDISLFPALSALSIFFFFFYLLLGAEILPAAAWHSFPCFFPLGATYSVSLCAFLGLFPLGTAVLSAASLCDSLPVILILPVT